MLPIIFFAMTTSASSASVMSLDDRVTVIETVMYTKADARAESVKAEEKADKAKAEMDARMDILLFESRGFSTITIIVALGIPFLTFLKMDEREARDVDRELRKEERQDARERDKEEKGKKSLKKDIDTFFSYFNISVVE